MLKWLRGTCGTSAGATAGVLGVLDELVNPGAARAREEMQGANEAAIPAPSPGDRLLRDGRITIRVAPRDAPRG
jgi:hypothetical protein